MNDLKKRYPKSNCPPDPDCPYCGGTGEVPLPDDRGERGCICIYVECSTELRSTIMQSIINAAAACAGKDTKK